MSGDLYVCSGITSNEKLATRGEILSNAENAKSILQVWKNHQIKLFTVFLNGENEFFFQTIESDDHLEKYICFKGIYLPPGEKRHLVGSIIINVINVINVKQPLAEVHLNKYD